MDEQYRMIGRGAEPADDAHPHVKGLAAAIKSHTGTICIEGDAEIQAWHLLCGLIELHDANGWNFAEAVRGCRETIACCKD